MAELFANGRIIIGIILLMLIECVFLLLARKKLSRVPSTGALFFNLGSGAFLLMALRAALIGSPWQIIATWLAAALCAHVLDVRLRWA